MGYRVEDAFVEWAKVLDRRLSDEKLGGLTQYWILLTLSANGMLSIADLSSVLRIKYTTVAESVNALASQGLANKQSSDGDRRFTFVRITRSGLARKEEIDLFLLPLAKQAFACLASEDAHGAIGLACRACKRQRKVVYFGKFIRGDTSFAVICQTVSMAYADICKNHRLSSLQARILAFLGQHGPKTNMDFCRMMKTDPASVSRATAKLRSIGLAEKQECGNKREAPQSLTQDGVYLAMQLSSEIELALLEIFGEDYRTPLFYRMVESMLDTLPTW